MLQEEEKNYEHICKTWENNYLSIYLSSMGTLSYICITCSMFCNQMVRFICPSVDMISPLETPYLWYIDGTSSSRLQRNKFTHNKTKLNTNEIEHFDVALKGKLLFSENIFRFGRRITQCIRFEQLCNEKSYFGASCLAVVISRSRKKFYSLFI